MNRIFSGIQPTGNLHLGKLPRRDPQLGGAPGRLRLASFCIVDMHALTLPRTPTSLRGQTREVTAAYIAAGIDPERCVIFNQRHGSRPYRARVGSSAA